ncbi:MAG: hypothetical protein P8N52_03945, partial [Crocinitomicaceae bacterium]|nr:hypothetical protein [Crocinitomicaceae bacterium]
GIMVLISILNSYLIFHQSFVASIIANSSLIEVFALSFIFIWLNQGSIHFSSLIKWLLISAWMYSVIVFLISALNLNFAVSTSEGMVCREAGKLSKHLIFFGFFFYYFLFRRKKKFRHLLYCFWFVFVTQIYDIQRGDIIFIVLTITLFSFIQSRYKGITVIGIAASGFFTLATLNYIFANSVIKDKFVQMSYFFQPEKWDLINDSSIAVRLREIEFVMSYIVESPFFGAGLVKPGNYTDYFGNQHFYIQDIGLIGIFFSFGLFGLIYYFFTLYRAIGLQKFVINQKLNVFGLNLYLLFFVLYGLKSGISVYVPFIMLFCIFSFDFVKHQHLDSEGNAEQDNVNQQGKLMDTIAKKNR